MEQSEEILTKINVSTKDLKVESIQELLVLVKKSKLNEDFWNVTAQILWKHLNECLEKFDDQLLCATCFYSVITLAQKEDYYLEKLLYILYPKLSLHSQTVCTSTASPEKIEEKEILPDESSHTPHVVSLMYGLFQSSFLIQKRTDTSKISQVLKVIFDILLLMGYEYSQYTFLVFKTIKSFKKVCGGVLETCIFNKENQVKLLALVNNNWESPVTGIRDLNRCIFQTVISTLDSLTYEMVLKYIDELYWNKAKFLMLSEIIDSYKGNVSLFYDKWVDGLMYSLHKPGLVSAGADMYYALLKRINTQEEWCQIFLGNIVKNIFSANSKAMENFSNYWFLTTLKKFGTLTNVFIQEIEKVENSNQVLYNKLSIMKQANKLGIIERSWKSTHNSAIRGAVMAGIEHCNVIIRMLAFEIVCVSHGKSIQSQFEYNLILNYLHNNVNSDSTVLRLSMLSSFNYFLVQLHSTFINVMLKNVCSDALQDMLFFCKELQDLITQNFNINGNYQRKITSVKLCNSLLSNFSEIPRKRKDQTRLANITLIEYLKQKHCWLLATELFIKKLISLLTDPADDIRESVVKILCNHYTNELQDVILLTDLINNAKHVMKSKFFYEISCGQSMFKLLTNLFITGKNTLQVELKSVDDIFDFGYNELVMHCAAKTNVLDSIETGKQLHSYISILIVVLEECTTNAYNINLSCRMANLLDVLEIVSNEFVWKEEGSSDFSKMSDKVQNIIESSSYNILDSDDCTKISGLQQIVLNCLWLNVKASCDLSSLLVQYNKHNFSMCEKCLNIITRVLETSRHKGAIEAAGAALGRAIQYLTSLSEERGDISKDGILRLSNMEIDVSQLPFILLKRKLDDLICETNKMTSITRRGAGLSIMVHRIVSSDMNKGKPLFHYFIKILLQICNTRLPTSKSNNITDNMENQMDLPKAIYIHFMTRIVTDSSLATDLMYYSVELAELAFRNLTSSHWQIRNAALQLYGALIPRLIGQKKASGTDEETIATVACDELRTHFPKLWKYIIEQLKQCTSSDVIQTHSNLVPILSMLANSAKQYNFTQHLIEQENEFNDLFNYLILLLGSPIYTVRRLTAKTIFNIYELKFISNGVMKQESVTENLLHGILLLVNLCYNYYNYLDSKLDKSFSALRDWFCVIFSFGTHSYLSKKLFEDIYFKNIDKNDIKNTILEVKNNLSPGVHIWAEARLKKYINKCSWNDIPSLLNMVLQQCDYEMYCEFIFTKLESDTNISTNVLRDLAHIFRTFQKKYCSSIIWKIMYNISQKINLECIKTEEILKQVEGNVPYKLRYVVPLLARNIEIASTEEQTAIINIINNLTDFENADVDMRYIAVIANNELACKLKNLPEPLKVISIKCAVLLLQDEDEDVRNLGAHFYSNLQNQKQVLQPYVSLNKILDNRFLCSVFEEPHVAIRELQLSLSLISHSNHTVDKYNPFANDNKNIYFESDVLNRILNNLNLC